MQNTFHTAAEELVQLHLRMRRAQVTAMLSKLKRCPPALLRSAVIDLINKKHSPLYNDLHSPGGPLYGKLLCWQKRRIGINQVHSFIRDWEDPMPRAAFIIATSGYTQEAEKYAKDMQIHLELIDLNKLIKDLLPDLPLSRAIRQLKPARNIHFLP